MRWIPTTLLAIGFPAWFVFWISNSSLLVYIYAVMGYAAVLVLVTLWAVGHSRCEPR